MNWFRNPGAIELLIVSIFLVSYLLFLLRGFRVSKALQTKKPSFWLKLIVRLAALTLMVVALLGPTFGEARREVKSIGKDIMICVDLSKSMDAFDIQPTRLEKVKFEMKRIVEAFNSDRLGIVIFSSESFVQCPLTFDQNALNLFIETMNTNLVPNAGTDFGPPLRMASDKLLNDPGRTGETSKVIVLISDGEDFGEDTESAAKEVSDENIQLFTLGIGTDKGSPIQTPRGYKTDRSGATVISRLNREPLKNLAEVGSGSYFELNDEKNDVPRMINAINSIEGNFMDSRMVDVSANRYFYFLLAAVVLIVTDMLLISKFIRI